MFGVGTTELIVIGVIVFLIFGAKRLPEIGKGLGGAIREFKNVKKDLTLKEEVEEDKEKDGDQEKKNSLPLENKLAQKVVEQIPGAKTVMDVKKKAEKVKQFID